MDQDASLDQAHTLHELWQAAISRPMHSPSCGCAVPSAVRIDPVTMELDLLDYAEHKRGLDKLPAWREAVERREAGRTGSLAQWLSTPQRTGLEPALHAQVVSDIANSLMSMASHAAGRLAPAGGLSSGWLAKGFNNKEKSE